MGDPEAPREYIDAVVGESGERFPAPRRRERPKRIYATPQGGWCMENLYAIIFFVVCVVIALGALVVYFGWFHDKKTEGTPQGKSRGVDAPVGSTTNGKTGKTAHDGNLFAGMEDFNFTEDKRWWATALGVGAIFLWGPLRGVWNLFFGSNTPEARTAYCLSRNTNWSVNESYVRDAGSSLGSVLKTGCKDGACRQQVTSCINENLRY